ncbi:MAG: hypothetical protein L0210_13170 [Rhodospirillales bacterium]|nr:hypothetical protein [Rhodospirillales bacterium]
MSRVNWLWGAPRIHGELLKLGIEIAESTVAKGKDAPISRSIEEFGRIIAEPMVGGLHHRYARM